MAKLFLLPVPIAEPSPADWLGPQYQSIIANNSLYFVENIRTARRFVSSLKLGLAIDQLRFEVLDKDTTATDVDRYIKLVLELGRGVVMSESGCPAVADPGSVLVAAAHRRQVEVVPVVGPSSLLLALMGSGLSGQHFCFHGYLPIKTEDRNQAIQTLERESAQRRQTQIFIETPYRNEALWHSLLRHLKPATRLAMATDILGAGQFFAQKTVSEWRKEPDLQWNKSPTVFLFLAE